MVKTTPSTSRSPLRARRHGDAGERGAKLAQRPDPRPKAWLARAASPRRGGETNLPVTRAVAISRGPRRRP
jgi:hypothetical protein